MPTAPTTCSFPRCCCPNRDQCVDVPSVAPSQLERAIESQRVAELADLRAIVARRYLETGRVGLTDIVLAELRGAR